MVDDERVALFVGKLVLTEGREKAGETLVDLLQTRLFRFAKRRTPTGEVRVDDFGESLLLEGEIRASVVNRFQAREQRLVLHDLIIERG